MELNYWLRADIVGARELLKRSPEDYESQLDGFRNAVLTYRALLGDESQLGMADGTLVVVSPSAKMLHSFFTTISRDLLKHSSFPIFLRAAVIGDEGKLISITQKIRPISEARKSTKNVFGFIGGLTSARLQSAQERFKGCGCIVDLVTARELKKYCFKNYYMEGTRGARSVQFYDLSTEVYDQNGFDASEVLTEMYRFNSMSKSLGKFFVPVLINCIRHRPIANGPVDKWKNPQLELIYYFYNGRFLNRFNTLIGVEHIVFSLVGRLYDDSSVDDELRKAILRKIFPYKRIMDEQGRLGEEVWSQGAQTQFVRDFRSWLKEESTKKQL